MTTMADKVLFFLLVLGIRLTPSQAVCNCGPNWNETQCRVDYNGCSPPTSYPNTISSAPAGIWAEYFVKDNNLGIAVTFEAPRENASLARTFDVKVIAMDYPVGFQTCVRVRLEPSTLLKPDQTFNLECIYSQHLVSRQRFHVRVQPYPTNRNRSNGISKVYQMPGCNVLGNQVGKMCDSYNKSPEQWKSRFIQVEPDSCGGLCVQVFFDTYKWPNEYGNISTYEISICTRKCLERKIVDCKDLLNAGIDFCNTTFYGLDPGEYLARQRLRQGNHIGTIKLVDFQITDPGSPHIRDIPKDIVIHVQDPNETISVTWKAPNVSNYIPSKVNLTSNFEPGDNFTVGVWTVTYSAEDYYKHRQDTASFTISIIDQESSNFLVTDTTSVSPRSAAKPSASKTQEENDQKLLIGGVAGSVTAIILLLLYILFMKDCKRLVKKISGRQSQTPTESTDPSVERDNLDRNSKVVHGSCDNALCDGSASQYPAFDDEEFQQVFDKHSLDGQVFGPSHQLPHHPPHYIPKVTVNCNITAGPTDQPTTWVTTHVENDPRLQSSIDPEPAVNIKKDADNGRLDSGIGEYPDIQSITQVSYTDEF